MANRSISIGTKKKAVELRKQGLSYQKIANEIGVTKDTVTRWFSKGGFEQACEEFDLDPDCTRMLWKKTGEFSALLKPDVKGMKELFDAHLEKMKEHAPEYKEIKHKKKKDSHLFVVDIADIHIGKHADLNTCSTLCNVPLAKQRALDAFHSVTTQATGGFDIDQIVLTIGNDVIQVDSPDGKTTKGTKVDFTGDYYDACDAALEMYVEMVETLLPIANVHVMHDPSNHDHSSGWHLAKELFCWFRKSKNITWDINQLHTKYFRYHNSLIASTHGDGKKDQELINDSFADMPQLSMADCPYRYAYCHHLHHKIAKEVNNGTVEYVRSTSTDDHYHNMKGYMAKPAGEGFIHSKTSGQISRITKYVDR